MSCEEEPNLGLFFRPFLNTSAKCTMKKGLKKSLTPGSLTSADETTSLEVIIVPMDGHANQCFPRNSIRASLKASVCSMFERCAADGNTTSLESGMRLCMAREAATGVP